MEDQEKSQLYLVLIYELNKVRITIDEIKSETSVLTEEQIKTLEELTLKQSYIISQIKALLN